MLPASPRGEVLESSVPRPVRQTAAGQSRCQTKLAQSKTSLLKVCGKGKERSRLTSVSYSHVDRGHVTSKRHVTAYE